MIDTINFPLVFIKKTGTVWAYEKDTKKYELYCNSIFNINSFKRIFSSAYHKKLYDLRFEEDEKYIKRIIKNKND